MGELRRRMEEYLKGMSRFSARACLVYCRKFAVHYHRSPEHLGEEEIRRFLIHVIQVEHVSYETYRQIRATLKLLYTVTLSREWEVSRIPFPKHQRRRLPGVLNTDQVLALLQAPSRFPRRLLRFSIPRRVFPKHISVSLSINFEPDLERGQRQACSTLIARFFARNHYSIPLQPRPRCSGNPRAAGPFTFLRLSARITPSMKSQ